jgi:hypothetical protein
VVYRRRRLAVAAALGAVAALALWAAASRSAPPAAHATVAARGGAGGRPSPGSPAPGSPAPGSPALGSPALGSPALGSAPSAPPPAPSTTAAATTTTSTTIDVGLLPQTDVLPPADSPAFTARMQAFWSAVTSGTVAEGDPAFFPESAYEQVKSIYDAGGDWTDRLLASYHVDITAAHGLLGPDAASAQLIGVRVNETAAHWVPPGDCYNKVGYFEVPNSRVVYQVDGQVRSFGIASMISWRGEWYIVHLGSVLGNATVDDPELGPGSPAPLYTC